MVKSLPSLVRIGVLVLSLAAIALVAAGCGTTDADRESEIPWNTPQPWEGAPTIPGMERM